MQPQQKLRRPLAAGYYTNKLKRYVHKPMQFPVIILCDNDDGPKTVFTSAKKKSGNPISKTTTDTFYHLGENLYLVKVPEVTPSADRDIEDLFEPALLETTVGGKPFDKKKVHGNTTAYGKVIFAEKVVRANTATIDFSGFIDLLSRIDQCITHYKTTMTATTPVATAGSGTP
jgi:RNA-directed DNA polymerase